MEINPFVICAITEQARFRQLADAEVWRMQCLALGADRAALQRYDAAAGAYAAMTIYPNIDVIANCRQLALGALLRGESMPETPEGAVDAENRRQLARVLEPAADLKRRFGIR
jgi:hypothetical protein